MEINIPKSNNKIDNKGDVSVLFLYSVIIIWKDAFSAR
jgi:hypothetical protein